MTGFDSKRAAAANKQEPAQESWREFASDYERGFIDGMQKQAQSSVDKAVNRMAQPAQEPVECLDCGSHNVGLPANYDSLVDSVKTQPAQEPVALVIDGVLVKSALPEKYTGHLYTTPPQRTEQEQPLPPVEIGVDVTADGASVVAFYRRPNAVMEMFYSQFHPAPQRTWVGLTDDEIESALPGYRAIDALDIYHAIEKALQEKNT